MRLELGLTYTVLKANGTTITFKFIGNLEGNQEVFGLVNNEHVALTTICAGGYLAYWEVEV